MIRRPLAVLGTGSDVGKSLIATALCRLWFRQGLRVVPFKAQNMSLNSFVTRDGGEISRAQAVQAWACGLEPTIDMNPVLLKPEADAACQVIVQGRALETVSAAAYYRDQTHLWTAITESYARLTAEADAVVLEGAGSAAELNLMSRDLVNWRMVEHADAAVVLVADIDRGGVFAQVLGTLDLLPREARRRVVGVLVNKFRGDASLFDDGIRMLETRGEVPVWGVIPYLREHGIEQEDSLDRTRATAKAFSPDRINIAVVLLERMSNFTDFDPLMRESDVSLRYVAQPSEAEGADVLILPGTKSTLVDLASLRRRGWATALERHRASQRDIVGICGGYQMLGHRIDDPDECEGGGQTDGFGFLDVSTRFVAPKVCRQVVGDMLAHGGDGAFAISGYEIHMGRILRGTAQPCFLIRPKTADFAPSDSALPSLEPEGARSDDGVVWGTSLHGIFESGAFRTYWLNRQRRTKGLALRADSLSDVEAQRRQAIDRWTDHVAHHLRCDPFAAPM
ncbi:MAG: cobyric acid synthase [Nitrospiraceae bacterium]